jgi:hypothetical protein
MPCSLSGTYTLTGDGKLVPITQVNPVYMGFLLLISNEGNKQWKQLLQEIYESQMLGQPLLYQRCNLITRVILKTDLFLSPIVACH